MKIVKKWETEVPEKSSLIQAVDQFKKLKVEDGYIVIYKGTEIPPFTWNINESMGLINRRGGDQLLLNGNKLLFQGKFNTWATHSKGFAIVREKIKPGECRGLFTQNEYILNGKETLYEGIFDEARECPTKGFIIRKGNTFLLNGTTVLYEGPYDGPYHRWSTHSEGVIIQKGDKILLNGKKCLFKGEFQKYYFTSYGIIIVQGNKYLLNGEGCMFEVRDRFLQESWGNLGLYAQIGDEIRLYPSLN